MHHLTDRDHAELYRLQALLLDRSKPSSAVRSLAAVQIGLILARIERRRVDREVRAGVREAIKIRRATR